MSILEAAGSIATMTMAEAAAAGPEAAAVAQNPPSWPLLAVMGIALVLAYKPQEKDDQRR